MNITAFTSGGNASAPLTLPSYILTPRPPLLPYISDFHLSLLLPVLAYWSISAVYHVISTYSLFDEYRIHTPAALKARNRVSALEVLRAVVTQQVVQTALGLFLGHMVLGTEEMMGRETYDVAVWALSVRRVVQGWVMPVVKGLVALIGIDARGWGGYVSGLPVFPTVVLGKAISTSGDTATGGCLARWEIWVAQTIYWVLDPAVRFGIAIFFSDTWQYFWHRAMHMNKWMYRKYWSLPSLGSFHSRSFSSLSIPEVVVRSRDQKPFRKIPERSLRPSFRYFQSGGNSGA